MTVALKQKKRIVKLHPYQYKTYKSSKRFVGMFAGTGGGKTYFGSYWMRERIKEHPNDAHLIVAPTYKLLQRNTLHGTAEHPGFLRTNADIITKYNQSKGEITHALGKGLVYTASADNPGSMEGCHVRSTWMDEAVQDGRLAWVVVQARIGFHLGRCLITTSLADDEVGGIGPGYAWLYKEIYKPWKDAKGDHPDIDVIQFTSIDNPHYPVQEYERAERALSPAMFALRYRGLFQRLEGIIYPEFPDTTIDPIPVDENWEKVGSIDFGYSPNPMVLLWHGIDHKSETWYQYREWVMTKKLLSDIAQEMKANPCPIWYADPSGKREIEELRSMGLPVRAAENAVDFGIQKVQELQRTGKMHTFNTCTHTIDEAETYRRDQNGKPIKRDDHCMDAKRYAVASMAKRNKSLFWTVDLKEED